MTRGSIGVDIGDLGGAPKDALRTAAAMSLDAVEVPTVSGDLSPESLSSSGRRHLARFVSGLGLHLAALQADMPGVRLTDPARAEERITRTIRVIELARDVGVGIVTTSAGALTDPQSGELSSLALEGLSRIGAAAESCGVQFAFRPGGDGGERIGETIRAVGCPSLKVGWDPAAMVMRGINPLHAIERYAEYITLFHARDALAGGEDRSGQETALGDGEVDLVGVFDVLRSLEYAGPYILRRTDSQRPVDELLASRDVLTRELRRS